MNDLPLSTWANIPFMSKFNKFLFLALLSAPLLVRAETPSRQHLFHIERSKNTNIVQYDVQIAEDGKLFKKKPVVGYWIRLAEEGQEKKLSWLQRTFAFGFDAELQSDRETIKLDMKADVGQQIIVVRVGDEYRATLEIAGEPSYFEKMYIDATLKGMSLTVRYVELFGEHIETGEPTYEKLLP